MICLIRSELKKVWGRKSFLFQLTGLYAGTFPE